MACNKCSCSNKYDKDLIEIAKKYEGNREDIIEALHEVQDKYGYISTNAQKCLSKFLNISMAEIYGIITFYSRFKLKPKGKYNIEVCLGTACYVKGSKAILEAFERELGIRSGQITDDGLFSLEEVRCIGACGLAPAIVINGEVYGKMTEKKVNELILKYREVK
ncbi:nADH:ubiquinone oxidoreductase 24 kD subunit [Clostridium sp. CAG:1219]|nr:nADH:ubiquinone oxidoreductase 24 kD subunit [Clostridium sp. CAG:1219]